MSKKLQNKSRVEFPTIEEIEKLANRSARNLKPVRYKYKDEIYDAIYTSYMNCAKMYMDLLESEFGYRDVLDASDVIEFYGLDKECAANNRNLLEIAINSMKRHVWNAAMEKAADEAKTGLGVDVVKNRILNLMVK